MKVICEDAPDGRMLKALVEEVAFKANVIRMIEDGAYDSGYNFRYFDMKGVEPVINVKSSSMKATGCMPRKLVVIEQLKDSPRWKEKRIYGFRWMAKSASPSLKRVFREHVSSVKWRNIFNELVLKVSIYNLFITMNT